MVRMGFRRLLNINPKPPVATRTWCSPKNRSVPGTCVPCMSTWTRFPTSAVLEGSVGTAVAVAVVVVVVLAPPPTLEVESLRFRGVSSDSELADLMAGRGRAAVSATCLSSSISPSSPASATPALSSVMNAQQAWHDRTGFFFDVVCTL